MNTLPIKDTLTQLSRVSFCMAVGILNTSESSFKKKFFFTYNKGGGGGGGFQNIFCSNF